MLISYSWLNSFFKKPLPRPEKLAELLTLHSFENENISEIKNDWILSLDVLPDRAGDCQSHLGVAREISAIIGHNLIHPEIKFKEHPSLKTKDFLEVEVKDKDCRRYISRVINNVKIGPSPKWISEKLAACNINSINNVVDATNFVMLELGQPLHAFDYDKIKNKKIIVKKAKAGEKISLLGGLEATLDKTTLTISDEEGAMAIAGIKGGKKAEIDNNTKNIVLESANFTSKLISQTARKINIRTDASMRFEHQLDPNLADIAIDRAATIIAQITEGSVLAGKIDFYPEKVKPIKLKLEIELLEKTLGVSIPQKEIETILSRLGFHVLQSNKKIISIEVPTWRQDVVLPENLIEEIGRIYGYEKINPVMPCVPITMIKKNEELFWQNKTKDILKNIGWTEVYNYSFFGDEEVGFFNLEAEEIKNPVSIFLKYLRPTLMPQILKNAKENLKFFKEIKLYELGKVFIKNDKKIIEKQSLSGIVINPAFNSQEQFLKLKGEIEYFLKELGIKKIEFTTSQENTWQSNNSLDIVCNKVKIGSFGQLSDDTAEITQLEASAMIFDLDFDKIQEQCREEKEYKKVSLHPSAHRDISGIINDTITNAEILEVIEKIEKSDLINVEGSILDVYKKGLPNNKKSITLKIILEHSEKTLNTEEIDTIVRKIINGLSDKFGWEERK